MNRTIAALVGMLLVASGTRAMVQVTGATNSSQAEVNQVLGDPPLTADSLGLTMRLPRGAQVSMQKVNGSTTFLMSDNPKSARWRMRAQLQAAESPGISATEQAKVQLEALSRSGQTFKVLIDEPRRYGGLQGHFLAIEQPPILGSADKRASITGWLMLPSGDKRFVVIAIMTVDTFWEEMQRTFDLAFQTVQVSDVDDLKRVLEFRLANGREFVKSITPERLESCLHAKQLYRIYRKGSAGDPSNEKEIGYLSMRCFEALRGEVESGRAPEDFRSAERQSGIMVELEARILSNDDPKHKFDVLSRFWMSWDRVQEAWSTRTTETQGSISRSFAQTGVRSEPSAGQPRPTLTVVNNADVPAVNDDAALIEPVPDDAYLSQVEVYLLGRLLPKNSPMPQEYSFYFFDAKNNLMSLRLDRWSPDPADPAVWMLVTQPTVDAPEMTQIFNAQGMRLRRVDGDGTITEPIEPRALERLWISKGLPSR